VIHQCHRMFTYNNINGLSDSVKEETIISLSMILFHEFDISVILPSPNRPIYKSRSFQFLSLT
jgi:hypothetical protein